MAQSQTLKSFGDMLNLDFTINDLLDDSNEYVSEDAEKAELLNKLLLQCFYQ